MPQAPEGDFALKSHPFAFVKGPQVPESPIPVSEVVAGGLGKISQ